ncbi:unnamed protein product [Phaedon cochleariae]|uniref:CS domain-containing protein n=1 Tax=Phaedon cochleariae TaxID=80249 RepID=A0A9P0DW46_PHACE|nr:unnamed protein product [Phaedon cochleariae]
MPIIIKDYTWKQTESNIMIQVPLRGVHQSKVDIFISSRYVKASYEQNYFEAILSNPVDKNDSKCILTATDIIFELKKQEQTQWELLEPNVSKAEKLELKKQFLEESYKEIQKDAEERVNKKAELKRVAVRKQIETDTETRKTIETIKKEEEAKALGDLEDWEKKIAKKQLPHQRRIVKKPTLAPPPKKAVPPVPIRAPRTLEIEFTPREFTTPSRESRLEEENEFLAKQAEARRTAGFVSEDIRPEERNPQFIKAKGDEFLKNKNYLGAISAYSYGIKLSKEFVDFYISRAEAHLAIGNNHKVLQDCSTALELLKPECSSNLQERAICIGRRGQALCKLGMKKQGLDELKFSLKLVHDDEFKKILETEEELIS